MYEIIGLDKSNVTVYFNGVWQRHPNKAGRWDKSEACRIASFAKNYPEIHNIKIQEIPGYAY